MPRSIRVQDPDFAYFVTNTCLARMMLLVPGKEMNDIFRRRLRIAAKVHRVEVYAAVCMGNHFHLIVRCPHMNLGEFMCYFQGLLARDVIKLRGLEDFVVFPQRYAAEPILDEDALLEKLRYVVMNPVEANLVAHPEEYPGFSSWNQHVGRDECELQIDHDEAPPAIVPPPFWQGLSADEIRKEWQTLIKVDLEEIRADKSRTFIGVEKLLNTHHLERPTRPRIKQRDRFGRKRKPRAHASSIELWQTYVRFVERVTTRYRDSVAALRLGEFEPFPFGTTPPGWTKSECNAKRSVPRRCCVVRRQVTRRAA